MLFLLALAFEFVKAVPFYLPPLTNDTANESNEYFDYETDINFIKSFLKLHTIAPEEIIKSAENKTDVQLDWLRRDSTEALSVTTDDSSPLLSDDDLVKINNDRTANDTSKCNSVCMSKSCINAGKKDNIQANRLFFKCDFRLI